MTMPPDIRDFYRATKPDRALVCADPQDRKYYIDFSTVRGGEIIDKLKTKITFFEPDSPTCALFTGHIGIKVIFSLREDYLHDLLECDRLESMKTFGNDILARKAHYFIGNFSREDDEQGTRPLKTRHELEQELQKLATE